MIRTTIAIFVVLILSSPLLAQNLLVNPGFDTPDQLTGWTCLETHGEANWIPYDRLGSPSSGSMEHFVTGDANHQFIDCQQCVPVEELHPYSASAWYYWPDDPDVTQDGTTRMSMIFYANPDCTSSQGVSTNVAVPHPALDTWYQLVTAEITAPPGTSSALVSIFTWQNFADQWVRARLDDLDVSTTILFQDGFESGGVGFWSSSMP